MVCRTHSPFALCHHYVTGRNGTKPNWCSKLPLDRRDRGLSLSKLFLLVSCFVKVSVDFVFSSTLSCLSTAVCQNVLRTAGRTAKMDKQLAFTLSRLTPLCWSSGLWTSAGTCLSIFRWMLTPRYAPCTLRRRAFTWLISKLWKHTWRETEIQNSYIKIEQANKW